MKIQLMQCTPRVGDIKGNVSILLQGMQGAHEQHADVVVFPELMLTGYPPEDLLLRPAFMDAVSQACQHIISQSQNSIVIFGAPRWDGEKLKNSAFIAQHGKLIATYDKQYLPNYGVFDEQRYFAAGDGQACIFQVDGWRIGISICEDLWHDTWAAQQSSQACDVWLNLNASPFHLNKQHEREQLTQRRAQQLGCPLVYINPVGGQDEIVFDGGSHVMDATGHLCLRAPLFQQGVFSIDLADLQPNSIADIPQDIAQIHQALVCGVRDYVLRNGSTDVVIGLSGGIDSALTAAIAVEALGAQHVLGVLLPAACSSDHSIHDAEALVDNLGIQSITLPIHASVNAIEETLQPCFTTWNVRQADVTEENIQARARGILLMAISNKTGRMLLTTGNKSEMAVGYATLYGDMAGGFAVLKDVYKMEVFALCRYLNQQGNIIPQNTIDKPPSAELRPDQKDADSLPDYAVLDAILRASIEDKLSVQDIIDQGYAAAEVKRIINMVHLAEYKRRQAPPGIKISQRAFGRDRRYPITHAFKEI